MAGQPEFKISNSEGEIPVPQLHALRADIIASGANTLKGLDRATLEIVGFDAYPHSGRPDEIVAWQYPFPPFSTEDKYSAPKLLAHINYVRALIKACQENPGAWLTTEYASRRMPDKSSIKLSIKATQDKMINLVIQKTPAFPITD